jgi:tripartite ATP-independent transporter DctM subunit
MAGEIMERTGITGDLVRFSNVLIGRFRGGLAHTVIVSSILISGITGSAASDAASLGTVLIPPMKKEGYELEFSAALIAATTAVIGPLIPPSIIMVIYSSVMDVSLGGLFLAGYLPGIFMGISFMIYVYFISKKRNYPVSTTVFTLRNFYLAFKNAIFALMMPIIIIGGIVMGVFTPTEASVVAVAYGFFFGFFIKKNLKFLDILEIMRSTLKISSIILFIIGAAIAFGWILSLEQIPQKVALTLTSITRGNFYLTLFIINIILLLAGMFLDTAIAIVLLGPVLLNTAIAVGVHPLHFAIIMCLNLSIGLITPPMGLVLFVMCGITGLSIERLTKSIWLLVILEFVFCLIVTYGPSISMIVPKYFGFYQ